MTARSTPCEGGCGAYTPFRFCAACQDVLASGGKLPGREDRFADLRSAARTVTTPETRRQAPPPVMPAPKRWEAVEVKPDLVMTTDGPVGFVRRYEPREVRATLPTEPEGAPIDRHAAVNRLIGFVTAPDTTDSAVAALLSEAERLKGAA